MLIGLSGSESKSVCNHVSDKKTGNRVWLQTEVDNAKHYYQLIIKITISDERRIAKLWKLGKILI